MNRLETTILTNLIHNENFSRKVLPFLKTDYFSANEEVTIFKIIESYIIKYNNLPSKEAISIELSNLKNITEDEFKIAKRVLETLTPDEKTDIEWLTDTTEKWCKDRAVHNAVLSGIKILDGKDKRHTPEAIPSILSEALAVSFDTHIGHDYLNQTDERYDYYHKEEERLKFDLSYFNRITKGGIPPKTLNVALAGTGVGKSLFMCHVAASMIMQGRNVLYITLEMAEERIAERIDANLLDVTVDELYEMPKQYYDTKIAKLKKKANGQLIIKEYPTASAHTGHFKGLIDELALKKSFKPDIVFIDYLNICTSARFRMGSNINTYTLVKSIAEELRGLAVEFNLPIFSATQTNRTGFVSTDVGLEDTSESFGLPATADFMFALMSNEELEALGQMKVKQLKNRYNDPGINRAFIIGVDKAKMRLYDVENNAQNIVGSNQTKEGENYPNPEKAYDKFSDFKL